MIISRQYNRLSKSVLVLMIATIFVKLIGFIKQIVVADFFGMTGQTDVFFISSEFMSNIASALFSALAIMLIPLYLRKREEGADGQLISDVIASFIIITLGLIIIGEILSWPLAYILTAGGNNVNPVLLTEFLRILFPTLFLSCLIYIQKSILEANRNFIPGRLIGAIQSVTIIAALVFLGNTYGVRALLYSFCLSILLQCVFLYLCKQNTQIPTPHLFSKDVKGLLKQMLPLFAGSTIADISVIVDKIISTNLGSGLASALAYGQSIKQLVVATLITTFISVAFVYMSDYVTKNKDEKVRGLMKTSIITLTLILFPIVILSFFCASDISKVVFERGKFSGQDSTLVAFVVQGYSFGFLFLAFRAVFTRVYYAYQNTIQPMINGIIAVGCNIVLSIYLSKQMGVIGITLATSISYIISSLLLYYGLRRHISPFRIQSGMPFVWRLFFSVCLSIGVVLFVESMSTISPLVRLVLASLATISVFYGSLWLMKCEELKILTKIVPVVLNKINHYRS